MAPSPNLSGISANAKAVENLHAAKRDACTGSGRGPDYVKVPGDLTSKPERAGGIAALFFFWSGERVVLATGVEAALLAHEGR